MQFKTLLENILSFQVHCSPKSYKNIILFKLNIKIITFLLSLLSPDKSLSFHFLISISRVLNCFVSSQLVLPLQIENNLLTQSTSLVTNHCFTVLCCRTLTKVPPTQKKKSPQLLLSLTDNHSGFFAYKKVTYQVCVHKVFLNMSQCQRGLYFFSQNFSLTQLLIILPVKFYFCMIQRVQ